MAPMWPVQQSEAGLKSVDLYCLEGYDEMPMGEEDRGECEEEGIRIHAGWGQAEVVTADGKCTAVRFRKMRERYVTMKADSIPGMTIRRPVRQSAPCSAVLHRPAC